VTAGRPSGYVSGLDYGSPDLHAFVSSGLIYPIDDKLSFDPDAMLRFYQRPGWMESLRFFANIDEDEELVAARVSAAMRELLRAPCQKSFERAPGAKRYGTGGVSDLSIDQEIA